MTDPFVQANDRLFQGKGAIDATYKPAVGAPVPVRIIISEPSVMRDGGMQDIRLRERVLQMRKRETPGGAVVQPSVGDRWEFNDVVSGELRIWEAARNEQIYSDDPLRLNWTIGCKEFHHGG